VKEREFEKLIEAHILPDVGEMRVRRSLLYADTPDGLLRGISFDTSGFSRDLFYLQAFVQALFVPVDTLVYQVGRRLRGLFQFKPDGTDRPEVMATAAAAIIAEGLPFLDQMTTAAEFAAHAYEVAGTNTDPYIVEMVGYSWIIGGHMGRGKGEVHRLLDEVLSPSWPPGRLIADRARAVETALGESEERARDLLLRWEAETRAALRLEPHTAASPAE